MNQFQQSSFGEMDLLRFMFELNHQSVDPVSLQQMIFEHQMRNQLHYAALTPPPEPRLASPIADSFKSNLMTTSTPGNVKINESQIPEPKIIFNYAPSITPEPERIDLTPDTTTIHDIEDANEDYLENDPEKLRKLLFSEKITEWCGSTIYHNMPDIAMLEYDRMLRDNHIMKVEVINNIHEEIPINYDYNPNKSRIRTNYGNPSIAEGRTKNNIASRRSRQRKKFQQHILQYSVEYDEDDNFLMGKQEKWLRAIVENLESKIVAQKGVEGVQEIKKLRKKSGFM
ncbi:hypothetical protein ACKWTF_014462 [Chironomus riparius]